MKALIKFSAFVLSGKSEWQVKERGIFSKCSVCGKQLNKWSLYCNECKKINDNKKIACDEKNVNKDNLYKF